MTLKEELEILRGEPIEVFDGDPLDIPCVERSDAEKLCKHPVVSVHMITYNHEPYIRQAIEGVMMQKTDLEFELVIGEDCSQDKTREICFEFQKKYPDKIRVLWWHENVTKFGGNDRRVLARCRGEFIAFCEGDDYWIDPFKLQKQVDVMRKHRNIGLCFCGSDISCLGTEEMERWISGYPKGIIPGDIFHHLPIVGDGDVKSRRWMSVYFIQTATTLVRASIFKEARAKYRDLFSFNLLVGDMTRWIGISTLSDVYYLEDVVSVYRRNPGGVTNLKGTGVRRDCHVIRMYYSLRLRPRMREYQKWFAKFIIPMILSIQCNFSEQVQKRNYSMIVQDPYLMWLSKKMRSRFVMILWKYGMISPRIARILNRLFYFSEDMLWRVYMCLRTKFSRA